MKFVPQTVLITMLFVSALMITPLATAQSPGMGTDRLHATGEVEIVQRPQFLQLSITLEGRSSDLAQAVEELKTRIKAAQDRVAKLNAIDTTLDVSKPSLVGGNADNAEQMMQMMQRYGGGNRGKQMLEATQSISIQQTLSVRWELPDAEDDYERLIATKQLTKKIRAADVGSSKREQPVSPAQAEVAEEMQAMMQEYGAMGGEEQKKTGEPSFSFVATVTGEQYQDAVKKAFQVASEELAMLATATDTQVDHLIPIRSAISSGPEDPYAAYRGMPTPEIKKNAQGEYEIAADNPLQAKCVVKVAVAALPTVAK